MYFGEGKAEGDGGKQKNQAELQKCVVRINHLGHGAFNKVTYALRQGDTLFICGYVAPE